MEFRKEDAWETKLDRLVAHAQAAGAGIVVYGHTHIPMVTPYQGIWMVNPGALASGTAFTAQSLCTVARMRLAPGTPPEVTHWALGETLRPVGFRLSILSPELERVEAAVCQAFSPDVLYA